MVLDQLKGLTSLRRMSLEGRDLGPGGKELRWRKDSGPDYGKDTRDTFRTLRGHKMSLGIKLFERLRQIGSQRYPSFSVDRLRPSRLLVTQADNKNTSFSLSSVPLHVVPHHSKPDIHSASHSQCQINNSNSTIIQLILQVLCRSQSSFYRWGP